MVSNKAELIRDMLEDGMSPKEIKEALAEDEIKVTSQYIYNVKRAWQESKGKKKGQKDDEYEEDDEEDDEKDEDFITRFPKEKRRKQQEFEDYECGACGAKWRAPRNKFQAACPECGTPFE